MLKDCCQAYQSNGKCKVHDDVKGSDKMEMCFSVMGLNVQEHMQGRSQDVDHTLNVLT